MRANTRSPGGRGARREKREKSDKALIARKKICRFCADKTKSIDYKDVRRLESFIRERGKMVSSRFSGNCAKHQRLLKVAIKKARFISLVPYVRL